MKIYTKTGDNLTTSTIKKRVYKDDLIIECVGTVDELSSSLMVSYNFIEDKEVKEIIIEIIRDLFNVSADIIEYKDRISITEERIVRLESLIDKYSLLLPELKEFILQGLNKASSHMHLSRTISRRLERRVVEYAKENSINHNVLIYLNRLSDLLYMLARYVEYV